MDRVDRNDRKKCIKKQRKNKDATDKSSERKWGEEKKLSQFDTLVTTG